MNNKKYYFLLLLTFPLLSSCGGSTKATAESTVTTEYELSSLDADDYKSCEYFGYDTNSALCADYTGDTSTYSVDNFSHSSNIDVYSGNDFIRLAEGRAILDAGGFTTDGSYSYTDSSGVAQSGSIGVAIIGSGVGIDNDVYASGSTDTSGYASSSSLFSFETDSDETGYAENFVEGISGVNDGYYSVIATNDSGISAGDVQTPYSVTNGVENGTQTAANANGDYIKNIAPDSDEYTEVFVYNNTSDGSEAYTLYTTTTQGWGIGDFEDACASQSSGCSATLVNTTVNTNTSSDGTGDTDDLTTAIETTDNHHDVDYFILETNDSANGTALASLINGPQSSTTYSDAVASGTTINSYKTMFDYGKYFALYESTEADADNTTNYFDFSSIYFMGEYTKANELGDSFLDEMRSQMSVLDADDGTMDYPYFFYYTHGTDIENAFYADPTDPDAVVGDRRLLNYNSGDYDSTAAIGSQYDNNIVEAYDHRSVNMTVPTMFLLEDSNGYQLLRAVNAAVTAGDRVLLLNNQFRNYYYENSSGELTRTNELNIYSYSAPGAFSDGIDDSYDDSGSNDEDSYDYVVERDFITVAEVDEDISASTYNSYSYALERVNDLFYDDVINKIKVYSESGGAADGESRAFVLPTDPSLMKMAILTDDDANGLHYGNESDVSSTAIDESRIASTYQNYLFVAGVNVDYYTTTTDSSYVEDFNTGLDIIGSITLDTTDLLSNDIENSSNIVSTALGGTSTDTDYIGYASSTDTIYLEQTLAHYGSGGAGETTGTNYAAWDCSGLLNCMIAPGNVFANNKYDDYVSFDEMDDAYIYAMDGTNDLADGYYTTFDRGYSNSYDDGVRDSENLATAYVTGAISMILGAYYEEYDEGTLTIDDIVSKMLNYATPAEYIVGCNAYYEAIDSDTTGIDCGVGMLNLHRTLAAACDDTNFDPDDDCTVTVTDSSSSSIVSLSSLTLGPAFGSSLSSSEATNLISQAVYYDNYNFKYNANLDSKIYTQDTNYFLANYLDASNSKTMYEHLAPAAAFSLDMAYTEYERIYDDGSTTRYFNGPVDPDDLKQVSFTNYSVNTPITNNSSFNLAMDKSSVNDLSPSYLSDLTTSISVTDANGYFALTGDSVNYSEFNLNLNDNISFNFGYISDANASFNSSSNLLFNNLNLTYKKTDLTLSFGSLIESDTMLSSEGSQALDFQDNVETSIYGLALNHKFNGKISLVASYNLGQTDVTASDSSIFQDFTDITSEEKMLGLVHKHKQTKIGFIYKEPMRVTGGQTFIQVPTKLHSDGSYSFANGWVSLSPDGKEQNFEIFMEKDIDANTKIELNVLRRVEPYHVADGETEDMAIFKLTKTF